jgi:ribonuclease P protein component
MLSAKYRLSKKDDFEKAIRHGAFFSLGAISLKFVKNKGKNTRIGFLVGKKSARKAFVRNAIKRELRHSFSQEIKNIKTGFDIVVFCNYYEKEGGKFKLEKNQARELLKKSFLLK